MLIIKVGQINSILTLVSNAHAIVAYYIFFWGAFFEYLIVPILSKLFSIFSFKPKQFHNDYRYFLEALR